MSRVLLVTRTPHDCGELAGLVSGGGWTVRAYPVLRFEPVDDRRGWEAALAGSPDRVLLASPRAAAPFVQQARAHGAEALLTLPVAVVGEGTAAAADAAGLTVELVGPGTGLGLAARLTERSTASVTFLFPCGRDRRPELPRELEAAGHRVLPVVVYRMRQTPPLELPPLGPRVDAVLLTSPRAARYYLEGVGGLPLPCPHWALGPTTRDAAAAMGIECLTPEQPNLTSFAEELCRN